jgi:hypothetical protein
MTTNYHNFRRCVIQTGLRKWLYDVHKVLAWLEEQRLGGDVGQDDALQPVGVGEVASD